MHKWGTLAVLKTKLLLTLIFAVPQLVAMEQLQEHRRIFNLSEQARQYIESLPIEWKYPLDSRSYQHEAFTIGPDFIDEINSVATTPDEARKFLIASLAHGMLERFMENPEASAHVAGLHVYQQTDRTLSSLANYLLCAQPYFDQLDTRVLSFQHMPDAPVRKLLETVPVLEGPMCPATLPQITLFEREHHQYQVRDHDAYFVDLYQVEKIVSYQKFATITGETGAAELGTILESINKRKTRQNSSLSAASGISPATALHIHRGTSSLKSLWNHIVGARFGKKDAYAKFECLERTVEKSWKNLEQDEQEFWKNLLGPNEQYDTMRLPRIILMQSGTKMGAITKETKAPEIGTLLASCAKLLTECSKGKKS